jgi:hypothetical protein
MKRRPEFIDEAVVIETEEDLMMATMEVLDAPDAATTLEAIHTAIHVTQAPSRAMLARDPVATVLHDRRMVRETDALQRAKAVTEMSRTAAWAPHQEMRSASKR